MSLDSWRLVLAEDPADRVVVLREQQRRSGATNGQDRQAVHEHQREPRHADGGSEPERRPVDRAVMNRADHISSSRCVTVTGNSSQSDDTAAITARGRMAQRSGRRCALLLARRIAAVASLRAGPGGRRLRGSSARGKHGVSSGLLRYGESLDERLCRVGPRRRRRRVGVAVEHDLAALSQMVRVQLSRMMPSPWLTRNTVPACSRSSRMRFSLRRRNWASPVARASSISRMLGARAAAMANRSRTPMPEE